MRAASRLLHQAAPMEKPTVSVVAASRLLKSKKSCANAWASANSLSVANSSSSSAGVGVIGASPACRGSDYPGDASRSQPDRCQPPFVADHADDRPCNGESKKAFKNANHMATSIGPVGSHRGILRSMTRALFRICEKRPHEH